MDKLQVYIQKGTVPDKSLQDVRAAAGLNRHVTSRHCTCARCQSFLLYRYQAVRWCCDADRPPLAYSANFCPLLTHILTIYMCARYNLTTPFSMNRVKQKNIDYQFISTVPWQYHRDTPAMSARTSGYGGRTQRSCISFWSHCKTLGINMPLALSLKGCYLKRENELKGGRGLVIKEIILLGRYLLSQTSVREYNALISSLIKF